MIKNLYCAPETQESLRYCIANNKSFLKSRSNSFEVIDGIPNLIFPIQLDDTDLAAKEFYEGRAEQYENTLHLTFLTHGIDENKTRNSFIDKLRICPGSKILEVACGTGRDSVLIADRLDSKSELHLQDISLDMIKICRDKLDSNPCVKSFTLANALYLPYPNNYFDSLYSFGAIGEFSDIKSALNEMVRVTKVGGKVVIGDESIPTWLRDTEYFRILNETNPMFSSPLPLKSIPVEARNTSIHFVIGQAFYLIEFEVGKGEPKANFDFKIPGIRGGTYNTRYKGKLEGVSKDAYELAWQAVRKGKTNMHDWLSDLIRKETLRSD